MEIITVHKLSFSTEPEKILLVGSGFLGKYLLTRMFEGYEEYLVGKIPIDPQPLATIIDKQNPDLLFQFPLLQNFQNKGLYKLFLAKYG